MSTSWPAMACATGATMWSRASDEAISTGHGAGQLAGLDGDGDALGDQGEQLGVGGVGAAARRRAGELSGHADVAAPGAAPGVDDRLTDVVERSADIDVAGVLEPASGVGGEPAIELSQQAGLGLVDAEERGPPDVGVRADVVDGQLVVRPRGEQLVGRVVEPLGVALPPPGSAVELDDCGRGPGAVPRCRRR